MYQLVPRNNSIKLFQSDDASFDLLTINNLMINPQFLLHTNIFFLNLNYDLRSFTKKT